MSNLTVFNQTLTNARTQDYLANVLGEKKSQFVNNLTALVANNKMLQACEPLTLMYAGIKATALDLPLDQNLGCAYVIPYNNKRAGKVEAQFQMGYKGFIQLAQRSGQFTTMNTRTLHEGEIKEEDLLTGELKLQRVSDREKKPVIGYVAFFRLVNGFSKSLYMTKEEVEAHANRYSQTYSNQRTRNNSTWTTNFDAMAEKTVLKLLLSKYAPLSIDMQNAVKADQAIYRDEAMTENYADNMTRDEKAAKLAEMAHAAEAPAEAEEVYAEELAADSAAQNANETATSTTTQILFE